MHTLAARILDEMKAVATEDKRVRQSRFFKEPVNLLGLMTAEIKAVVKSHHADVKHLRREQVFELCEALMQMGYWETVAAATMFAYDVRRKFQKSDFKIFTTWQRKYITNWANCDEFCNRTVNAIVEMYPELVRDVKQWAKSKNRWMRRGAAVIFILSARRGRFLDTIFDISDMLIHDTDEMVQKGYGWALKEAGARAPERVYDYIAARRDIMPRKAFRYAIEKFTPHMRAAAMKL